MSSDDLHVDIAAAEPLVLGRLTRNGPGMFPLLSMMLLATLTLPLLVSVSKQLTRGEPSGSEPVFMVWNDAPMLVLLVAGAVGVTIVVAQWRLMESVFRQLESLESLRPMTESSRSTAVGKIADANAFFRGVGNPVWRLLIGGASVAVSVVVYRQITNQTEFYGFLAPPRVGEPGGPLREEWSNAALANWWGSGRFGGSVWVATSSLAAFATTIQILCGARFMELCRSLSSDLEFGIDYHNIDGDHGRSPIRKILTIVYAGVFIYAIIILDFVFIARGSVNPAFIAPVLPFLVLNVAYIWLPLRILRQHGGRQRARYVRRLRDQIDHAATPADRHALVALIDRCHAVPLSIFRLRTIAVAVVAYALPATAAVAQMWELFAE